MKKDNLILVTLVFVVRILDLRLTKLYLKLMLGYYEAKAKISTFVNFLKEFDETWANCFVIILNLFNSKLMGLFDTNCQFLNELPAVINVPLKILTYIGISCFIFGAATFILHPKKGYGENGNYKDAFILYNFKFLSVAVITAILNSFFDPIVASIVSLWAFDFFKSFAKEEIKEKWAEAKRKAEEDEKEEDREE